MLKTSTSPDNDNPDDLDSLVNERDFLTSDELIEVFNDTVSAFKNPDGRFHCYGVPSASQIVKNVKNHTPAKYPNPAAVVVENTCTLDMCKSLIDAGLFPLVLNMASNIRPGGGVRKGAVAQEEDLFRKSNYSQTLDVNLLPVGTYPLKGLAMVHSPNVTVVKGREYHDLQDPFAVTFVACPAVRKPSIDENGYCDHAEEYLMAQRIERIYKLAYTYGHDSLVLGAFGCGAFRNPPTHIAKVFWSVIDQYAGFF